MVHCEPAAGEGLGSVIGHCSAIKRSKPDDRNGPPRAPRFLKRIHERIEGPHTARFRSCDTLGMVTLWREISGCRGLEAEAARS